MATLASAKAKYARKAAAGAAKYNAAKGSMPGNYSRGVAEFLGRPPGPLTTQAYQAGIAAAQYRAGDPEKWERNYVESMSR